MVANKIDKDERRKDKPLGFIGLEALSYAEFKRRRVDSVGRKFLFDKKNQVLLKSNI